jgi:hydroxymethylpyrimidine pyrophosphatase-like HAD family hydrolase
VRYWALACDFDGTLAEDGHVAQATHDALLRLRASGRTLILLTGRTLDDLAHTCPHLDRFDRVVAENGALLYCPATSVQRVLAPPPSDAFVRELLARAVRPLSAGQVILASWHPHEATILQTIYDLGLDYQLAFNKGAVMVLPPGVTKASGLTAALDELHLSVHNVVGIGDAENDLAFLAACECAVAVANALPSVTEGADLVTAGTFGAGVVEVADALLEDDLAVREPHTGRHDLVLGTGTDGSALTLGARGGTILLAGPSGSGKSRLAVGLVEALVARGYQVCVIDPEGDYTPDAALVSLGGSGNMPSIASVLEVLARPSESVVVNLLGVPLDERPAYFATLLEELKRLRAESGRPHWLIVDEAHHLLPAWQAAPMSPPAIGELRALLITVAPEHLSPAALAGVELLVVTSTAPEQTVAAFLTATGIQVPDIGAVSLLPGEALVWDRYAGTAPARVQLTLAGSGHRRHQRKYAEGDLGPTRSFYFRGPHGHLQIAAHNLAHFLELAQHIDDATWRYHLQRGDYSHWMRDTIADSECADDIARIETAAELPAAESRARIRALIKRRYTMPA